jgi:CheY-like chemotaxis protein
MHRQSWSLMGGLIFAPPLDSGPIKLSTQNSGNHKEVPSYNSTPPHADNSRDCHGEPVVDSPISTEHCSYLTGDHCVSEEHNHDGSAQKPDLRSIGIDRLIDQEKVYSRSSTMCEASGDPIINTALQEPLTSLHERYSNGRDTQESSVFWNPPQICPYSTLNKDPSLNNGDPSIEICNSESERLPGAIDAEKTNSKPQEPSHLCTQFARPSDMNIKGIGELPLPIGLGDSSDSSQQQHRSIPGKVASYQSIRGDRGSVKAGSEMFVPGAPLEASRMRPVSEVGAKDDLGQTGSNSIKLNGYEDGKLTILLAEDNEINQKVASRQLQKHGHLVKIVSDGQQALDVVRSQHDVLDLVLMDVQVPTLFTLYLLDCFTFNPTLKKLKEHIDTVNTVDRVIFSLLLLLFVDGQSMSWTSASNATISG